MSTGLKASASVASTTTTQNQKITWPAMELPAAHPVFGAPAEINDALQRWYTGVQNTVGQRLDAMSATISAQAAQIKTLNSQLKTPVKP
jgi:hypothetical protein